ncbi:hypothetical protein KAR91_62605 [Candidatus Pacearchaeota archaeon]|nr:hypothetical protein [Candidatus Pacearchaeota archaeon]
MAGKKKKKAKKKTSSNAGVVAGDFTQASNGDNGNRVYFSIGKTCNIGNYESIRVEVGQGMTVKDGATKKDFNEARDWCIAEATGAIKEIVDMVDSGKMI